MENFLNIVEVLHKEEETFDEENVKFISSKISIGTFFDASYYSYLDLSIKEKSERFRWYYNNLVSKYFDKSVKLFSVFQFESDAFVSCLI